MSVENGADKAEDDVKTLNDLLFEDGVRTYITNKRDTIEKADKIAIFGSSRGGERVYSFLREWDLSGRIFAVVDNDIMKQGKFFHGIEIISVESLEKYLSNHLGLSLIVIIASGSAHIIKNQLIDKGLDGDILCPFITNSLNFYPTPCEYFLDHKDQIKKVYGYFEDDRSKDVFISLLNYRMTRDDKWLKNISDNEEMQYFDECMNYRQDEFIVDCGAYIGDTLLEFDKKLVGKWSKYFCFEADEDVFYKLDSFVKENSYKNVITYNVGCWNERTTLYFQKQGSGSSQIVEDKISSKIDVDSLDNVLKDMNVTVIKMDIEGAEFNALKGAERIIMEHHPRLAISTYHSMEDFIYLPEIIHDLGYRIVLRHYREMSDSETVCYGV